jgi:hypothetical protein
MLYKTAHTVENCAPSDRLSPTQSPVWFYPLQSILVSGAAPIGYDGRNFPGSESAPTGQQVENQHDDCYDKQKMNQAAGDMEAEAQQP